MRRWLSYYFLALACFGCANSDSVNILISNPSKSTLRQVRVAVSFSEIKNHLSINDGDTLYLLNEANSGVPYSYTAGHDSIVFSIPEINGMSQKNYSLNVHEKRLADNLFRFRTTSIMVDVGN